MPIFPISLPSVPCASITRLRVVLLLMKHLRQKELLRFFRWLAGFTRMNFPLIS